MKAKSRLVNGPSDFGLPNAREEAALNSAVRCESVLYDFTNDGGAVSTITLRRHVPAGAIITSVIVNTVVACTSGGAATVQLKYGTTAITALLAFDTGFGGVGAAKSVALLSAGVPVIVSADSELAVGIATAALTAGKLRFHITYVVPNDFSTVA